MSTTTPAGATSRASLHATTGRIAAVATALLLVLFLVLSVSRAAFTATTANDGNSVSTGTVSLTDDDLGAAMFVTDPTDPDDGQPTEYAANLGPNDSVEHCINVTYDGAFDPQMVRLYIDPAQAPGGTLAQYLDVEILLGTVSASSFNTCVGFVPDPLVGGINPGRIEFDTLANIAANHQSYATGINTWDPAGTGETRAFKFIVTVQNNPAAAGLAATNWGVTWETTT